MSFNPNFTITNRMTQAITRIERARGFLEAAQLSADWVRERTEQVIRRDVLVKQHGLNERQGKALGYLLRHGKLTIQDFETLCPTVNRRSLQRDLKGMLDMNLLVKVGAGATDPTRHYVLGEL
jgi:hypothetical protein